MKARVQIDIRFDLGKPEAYEDDVVDWIDAARSDLDDLLVDSRHGHIVFSYTVGRIVIEGDDEFIRLEGDDQEGE